MKVLSAILLLLASPGLAQDAPTVEPIPIPLLFVDFVEAIAACVSNQPLIPRDLDAASFSLAMGWCEPGPGPQCVDEYEHHCAIVGQREPALPGCPPGDMNPAQIGSCFAEMQEQKWCPSENLPDVNACAAKWSADRFSDIAAARNAGRMMNVNDGLLDKPGQGQGQGPPP